jgi:hypothetical protein
VAYVMQVEALERRALALQALAPYADDPVPSTEEAVAEFDEWLAREPVVATPGGMDELKALITVGGG